MNFVHLRPRHFLACTPLHGLMCNAEDHTPPLKNDLLNVIFSSFPPLLPLLVH